MTKNNDRGLGIFLKYWALFALLGGFNVYLYARRGSYLSLFVAIACGVVFVAWILFYIFYVRRRD